PRGRHAELLGALALVAASLERFAVEIRHLARTELAEVAEPFGRGQKGSSAMPHKRNPVIAERLCGLARVVRANAMVGLENVALWHERDISHSSAERVVIPDSFLALDYMLDRFAWLVEGLEVRPERMLHNLEAGHWLFSSQRVLLALVESGLERDAAYRLVQRDALRAQEEERDFRELVRSDLLGLRDDGRSTECRRLEMLPLECVVRGYLAGSGWKDYRASGAVCGHELPPGLRESERLPEPIFTPSTKALEGHDENIDRGQAAALVGGGERFNELERVSL